MRSLGFAATVWVPVHRVVDVGVQIDEATERYGGVTRTRGSGEWHDGSGYIERETVILHEWWSVTPVDVSDVIKGLLEAGEKEVMVSLTSHLGRYVNIFTKEDFPMKAEETTKDRTFTIEVNEEELHILHSLVGYCSASALGQRYDGPEARLLPPMYHELERALGTQGEDPKYDLDITKRY